MADPAKMAALTELAETGSFGAAQSALGQSRAEAAGRQSALGATIGAPAAASASVVPTVDQPYGRFSKALDEYAGSYANSAANQAGANEAYMAQVAAAQGAHRAEANRAIAEAQAAAAKRAGSGGGGDLSQWEIEARAEGLGNEYQDQAVVEQQQTGERNEYEAELARQLEGWRTIGDEDAQGERSMEHELAKNGPTGEEKVRAQQQWYDQNPSDAAGKLSTGEIDRKAYEVLMRQRALQAEQFVDEFAGSDRIGSRDARERAYQDTIDARSQAPITLPTGDQLSTRTDGTRESEASRYAGVREQGAADSFATARQLEDYTGPEFTRQAALDLNLLPDLPPELQEIQYRGMFPDQTPQELMDEAQARREAAYFEETGFSSPTEQRSWEEAERKRAGLPDPNNRDVRRPDDPDVLALTGLDPARVEQMRSTDEWEAAVASADTFTNPPDDLADQAVFSPNALKVRLESLGYPQDMVALIVAMYGPSLVG